MSNCKCNNLHLLLLAVGFSAISVRVTSSTTLTYTVPEEEGPRDFGSVITDADLASKYGGKIPPMLRFSLLTSSPYIGIDAIRSTLRTMQRIDRETICMDEPNELCVMEIDIVVGPNTPAYFQMIKARVTISDINDNSPIFPQPVLDLLVPENAAVNSTLYLPMAEDRDSEDFGVADYELVSHTEAFRITSVPAPFGGSELLLILAKELDRETQGSYTLKLVARDYGYPSRTGMMLLNITVGDDNDNSPQFQQPLYSVRVPESAQPQIMLTRVLANDRDSGANGAIKYALGPRTNAKIRRLFEMDEKTGELFLRQRLDYESDKSFLIPIIASDSAPMPKRGQSVVNISIADENDNSPHITVTTVGSRRVQVKEHSPNGTFVAHVRVKDDDSGSNGLVACIISSPYFLLRQSYENEYNLVVNSVLDREVNNELNVTILCSDGGSPQRVSRENLTINIVDVNDQKPTFDRLVYFPMPILENNNVGMTILQVKARDRDADTNAEIQYQLGDELDASYFSVDRISGMVKATTRLDREAHKDYTFSVLAIDRGEPPLTATAAVYIRLADVNDNPPRFNVTHYQMAVAENMPKYSFVGKVSAQDLDEGANGDIWYRMVNASTGPFIIAHDTGIISTRVPLDREKVGGSMYQITVIATDYGTPALSSQVKINIDIIDENDNVPIITSPDNVTFTTSYQTPANETFSKLIAYDADVGDNGKLGFFIQSGDKYKLFGIHKSTGEIKLRKPVDSSMVGYYRLVIGVHDNGLPPHTVITTIGIQITKDLYTPYNLRVGQQTTGPTNHKQPRTYNANLIVVIVLSSTSGVLSIILIIAIIRIKRQTKENHSYNCRTEAQKLFNYSGRSSHQSQPSCGSSWAGLSTADQSSVFSRGSASSENDADEPDVTQTFLTTFSTSQTVMTALQTYDKSNLVKASAQSTKPAVNSAAKLKGTLDQTIKEPDSDSGNCDDVCSVHNSTPVLTSESHVNPASTAQPTAHQSFQYKFMSTTGLEGEVENKVPSSISSGNNSITTNSSQAESPATRNSIPNHKHQDGTVISGHSKEGHLSTSRRLPRLEQSSSDNYPAQNTSDMSDQTINGDRLCAHIDDLFFSEIV